MEMTENDKELVASLKKTADLITRRRQEVECIYRSYSWCRKKCVHRCESEVELCSLTNLTEWIDLVTSEIETPRRMNALKTKLMGGTKK